MDHSEYEAAEALLEQFEDQVVASGDGVEFTVERLYAALWETAQAYRRARTRPHPRLSCLRTALRALTGALRDRMDP